MIERYTYEFWISERYMWEKRGKRKRCFSSSTILFHRQYIELGGSLRLPVYHPRYICALPYLHIHPLPSMACLFTFRAHWKLDTTVQYDALSHLSHSCCVDHCHSTSCSYRIHIFSVLRNSSSYHPALICLGYVDPDSCERTLDDHFRFECSRVCLCRAGSCHAERGCQLLFGSNHLSVLDSSFRNQRSNQLWANAKTISIPLPCTSRGVWIDVVRLLGPYVLCLASKAMKGKRV